MRNEGQLSRVPFRVFALVAVTLAMQIGFWSQNHSVRLPVSNVDPAPPETLARIIGLGDPQFYYRAGGMWLQNMGERGNDVLPLQQLNYDRLSQWFDLLLAMDDRANYVPMLAGFYYGYTPDPEQARKVALFLRRAALKHPELHWRWLAHAVYLARHRVKDMDLALEMANQLAALPVPDMPIWTRQMNAFILAKVGDREAARDILEALLASDTRIDPAERRFIIDYIEKNLKSGFPVK